MRCRLLNSANIDERKDPEGNTIRDFRAIQLKEVVEKRLQLVPIMLGNILLA
ncbi:hypothetical protein DPMN_192625 [Dreissena polymorpha]|uniref:Uncharacterized protein n=1 Tax=Dreissena polymorpha TaxID=45954 RepID=A0A9D3Y7F2_DREPO|nr:hypothetical protein DPMN_192625 [Dreissena polymorpha]